MILQVNFLGGDVQEILPEVDTSVVHLNKLGFLKKE